MSILKVIVIKRYLDYNIEGYCNEAIFRLYIEGYCDEAIFTLYIECYCNEAIFRLYIEGYCNEEIFTLYIAYSLFMCTITSIILQLINM